MAQFVSGSIWIRPTFHRGTINLAGINDGQMTLVVQAYNRIIGGTVCPWVIYRDTRKWNAIAFKGNLDTAEMIFGELSRIPVGDERYLKGFVR